MGAAGTEAGAGAALGAAGTEAGAGALTTAALGPGGLALRIAALRAAVAARRRRSYEKSVK